MANLFIIEELKKAVQGEILFDEKILADYSRDASVVQVFPKVVVRPKDATDVKAVVNIVAKFKKVHPELSITPRSAGTDMSGGPLGESIILDINAHMQGIIGFEGPNQNLVRILPGTFYRDLEAEATKRNLFLPSFPASWRICTVGGMVANNSAGEKTLTYGQTKQFVKELRVVFRDGNEYVVKPLTRAELQAKVSQHDFEGDMYKEIWKLISTNMDEIMKAKPKTSKNSTGYYLWDVWDQKSDTFDLTKLIVGSQGTLGIVTEIVFELMPRPQKTQLLTVFLPSLDPIGPMVQNILAYKPLSLESYDEDTIKLAVSYIGDLLKHFSFMRALRFLWDFIPEFAMALTGGYPKLMLLIEFGGNDPDELRKQARALGKELGAIYKVKAHLVGSEAEAEKYWTIRHESYNLLRTHAAGKKIATFIEDVVVNPDHLPEFLPKLREILKEYKLTYSIAGHAGSGNFHIFPLMDFNDPSHIESIMEISEKIYRLVSEHGGSISAEHNDGIVRTPYLGTMYSAGALELFKRTKELFDPSNMFNPGKKVNGTKEYFKAHILKS